MQNFWELNKASQEVSWNGTLSFVQLTVHRSCGSKSERRGRGWDHEWGAVADADEDRRPEQRQEGEGGVITKRSGEARDDDGEGGGSSKLRKRTVGLGRGCRRRCEDGGRGEDRQGHAPLPALHAPLEAPDLPGLLAHSSTQQILGAVHAFFLKKTSFFS